MKFTSSRLKPLIAPVSLLVLSQHADAQAEVDAWRFTVGVGAVSAPRYPGSSENRALGVPVLSAGYGRYFIGAVPGAGIPAGVGAYLVQQDGWRLGIGLGGQLRSPRKESDATRLRGLGDIDGTALGSVFGSYAAKWFDVRASVTTDVGGKGQGTQVAMDIEPRYAVTDRLSLSAGPGITWADKKHTQTFFGVTAAQAASSSLRAYETGSGASALRFGVGANYALTPRWNVSARVTASRLQGDAVDSPITERRLQNTYGFFASYRF